MNPIVEQMYYEGIKKQAGKLIALINRYNLAAGARTSDIGDKAQFTHKPTRVRKQKGGRPPVDYLIIDLKVDLELAIQNGDNKEMEALFFQLKRLILG